MTEYDLKSVSLPKMEGKLLTVFAKLLQNPLLSATILPSIMKNGGITKLKELRLKENPLYYPLGAVEQTGEALPLSALTNIAQTTSSSMPFVSIGDLAAAYRTGAVTPLMVAQKALASIKKSEQGSKPLRAFIHIHEEDVLALAKASTERFAIGKPLSDLDGIPIAIKDDTQVKGYPTTTGTKFLAKGIETEDADIVARLRHAGAVFLGKANLNEIGITPAGHNIHFGHARNPNNPDYDTGGSSSGPATAVAAGFCPVSIGADGGGSIRIPAAHCGLVGLKATFARVSEHGTTPLSWSMTHIGPIGATVADVALTYAVVAGADPKDPISTHQPAVTLEGWDIPHLNGIRLGIFKSWFEHATQEIVQTNQAALEWLVQAGAQIVEIDIPELDAMRVSHACTILSEMALNMGYYPDNFQDFSAATQISLTLGSQFSAVEILQAQRMRQRAMDIFSEIYQKVDVIITPSTAITAPLIPQSGIPQGQSDLSCVTETMRYVIPGNLVGLPAISFPVGYGSNAMPIGMQAMGRHWEEPLLLRIANIAEKHLVRKKPQIYYSLID